MTSSAPNLQPEPESPSTQELAAPRWSADAELELREPADPIAELRLMAAGQFFGLPLSHAHAKAAVAHIDQLKECVAERDQMIADVLGDWLVAEIARRNLERMLEQRES